MASSDLRAKLKCFICKKNYKDFVMLPCRDKFCRVCIDRVLDTQGRSGGYSCPKCRTNFQRRPTLQRNTSSTCRVQSYQKKSEVSHTHCVDPRVPAVRAPLRSEASLYKKHPRAGNTAPDHVLSDPTTSSQIGKCSTHHERLKYYCITDNIFICASCRRAGEHRGHQVETLDEASGKKKTKLRNVKQKLLTKREETEERVQSLQEHRRKVEEEAAGDTERVTVLFRDLRRRLDELEKRVLREISGRAERISISIQDLGIKKDELSRKLRHIEELCNMTDPLTVLQESDTGDLCDTEDGDNEDRERHDGGGLDVAGISHTLHTLSDIITEVNVDFYKQNAADILLDVNTAHNYLHISDDRKTISWSDWNQKRPETQELFKDFPQVLGSWSFSSGRHYWDVDVGGSDWWKVGMCYHSMDRAGEQSGIGKDNKSWGLLRCDNQCSVRHGNIETSLPTNISSNRVRIYLDYEAGRISFYDLCDPIRHLHTFTTTFTEPLHAGLGVKGGCIKILEDVRTLLRVW